VCGAKGVYPSEVPQAEDSLMRRGVGHAIEELLGPAAFRISPVWVFAALADLSGLGRRLIPEIADALKVEGLLEKEAQFENVDQLLDGLKTSSRRAQPINAPPIDVALLRTEWTEIRLQARGLKPLDLPSVKEVSSRWEELKDEAARQGRSIFETSSVMAISAIRALPDRARWLSSSTRVGAARTGKLFSAAILEDYSYTLHELREVGYVTYAKRQLSPYLRACVDQFSRQQRSMTERLIDRIRKN